MKLGAYVLASDPTWITESISAYYDYIDVLVVSYDSTYRGWTGAKIPVGECLQKLRNCDTQSKIVELPGTYSTGVGLPIDRDTKQRQECIDYLSDHVDWILQIDTDEYIPNVTKLIEQTTGMPKEITGIEWPMRVLFRKLSKRKYLAISNTDYQPTYEYPGPILVRSHVTLVDARRTTGTVVRYAVLGDTSSLQLQANHVNGVDVRRVLDDKDAVIHNSWARNPDVVWRKVASWGHHEGIRSLFYYLFIWLPAPITSKILNDFHPFAKGLWPKLTNLEVGVGE